MTQMISYVYNKKNILIEIKTIFFVIKYILALPDSNLKEFQTLFQIPQKLRNLIKMNIYHTNIKIKLGQSISNVEYVTTA